MSLKKFKLQHKLFHCLFLKVTFFHITTNKVSLQPTLLVFSTAFGKDSFIFLTRLLKNKTTATISNIVMSSTNSSGNIFLFMNNRLLYIENIWRIFRKRLYDFHKIQSTPIQKPDMNVLIISNGIISHVIRKTGIGGHISKSYYQCA